MYISLNIALLGANFKDRHYLEEHYSLIFHQLAFWGLFVFTILEAFLLFTSETIQFDSNSMSQPLVMLFNVLTTFAAAILFTIHPTTFEVPSHYLEFSIQIVITLVNFIFIWNNIRSKTNRTILYRYRYLEATVAVLLVCLAIFQLLLYSGLLKTKTDGERAAHFCEFVNEIFNGLFALFFAVVFSGTQCLQFFMQVFGVS